MTKLIGTKTIENLCGAFAGESQARVRYELFATRAKEDGAVQVAKLFLEIADQEKEHAKRIFKLIGDGAASLAYSTKNVGFAAVGSTEDNLLESIKGEEDECERIYLGIAKTAEDEGLLPIFEAFRALSVAERHHMERFSAMAEKLRSGTLRRSTKIVPWECLNCGYVHIGVEPPMVCAACSHGGEYFAQKTDRWA
ncbi:MAG: rubrerythrin family protein [Puniceicoccales bacterium]|jgi:rubrerythrin|nr:rubrerythrin family protein [Puniceicoccales bacterium]